MSSRTHSQNQSMSYTVNAHSISEVVETTLNGRSYLVLHVLAYKDSKGIESDGHSLVKVLGNDITMCIKSVSGDSEIIREAESELCSDAATIIDHKVCRSVTLRPKAGQSLEGECYLDLEFDIFKLATISAIETGLSRTRML